MNKTRAGRRDGISNGRNQAISGNGEVFNSTIIEQAEEKKPPFNVQCQRVDAAATKAGFLTFNPGPGSYTTRMSSIKTNFVPQTNWGMQS
jgi:hypothetical protein